MNKLLCILLTLFAPLGYAVNDDVDFVRLTFDNDSFHNEDSGYTYGVISSWGYNEVNSLDDETLPLWIAYLADKTYLIAESDRRYGISYSIGQLLQTALDTSVTEVVEEDAPYVGLLAWEGQLTAYNNRVSDELTLTLGMVGPVAGGEPLQSFFHNRIAVSEPQGWGNQISNEFVLRLQGKRSWRVFDTPIGNTEFDVITTISAGIGNLRSDLSGGVGIRWGQALQRNFFSAPSLHVGVLNRSNNNSDAWYLFAHSSASYVANDIFIDGNTFQDSHSVDLINEQMAISAGVMVNIANWSLRYTFFALSDRYQEQRVDQRFGSLSITYNF